MTDEPAPPEFLAGVICWKRTPNDERLITVIELSFGRARINRGSIDGAFYDDGW